MKKILLTLTFIIISQYSYGQVYLGVASGVSISKFYTKDDSPFEYSSLPRFNFGFPVLFKLNKNVGFESGISYINMGSTMMYNFNPIDQNDPIYISLKDLKYYFNLNYVSVPLTFNYSVSISTYTIYSKTGGYLSYALNGNITNNKNIEKEKINFKEEEIKKLDLGLVVGIGATRKLGDGFIFLEARYMIGCSNLTNDANTYSLATIAYNRSLILNVGYMFNLGKS